MLRPLALATLLFVLSHVLVDCHDGPHGPAAAPGMDHGHDDHSTAPGMDDHDHDHDHSMAPGMDDHEHDHGMAPGPGGDDVHGTHMVTAAATRPPASQMCFYYMGKCSLNRAWVADTFDSAGGWAACTWQWDSETTEHAAGWDCASAPDGADVSMCHDVKILHQVSADHAHNMYACAPESISSQEAQQFWDAFDEANVCLMDDTMDAESCGEMAADALSTELSLVVGTSVPPPINSVLADATGMCASAATEAACMEVVPGDTMTAALTAAQESVPAITAGPAGVLDGATPTANGVVALIAALLTALVALA